MNSIYGQNDYSEGCFNEKHLISIKQVNIFKVK